MAMRQQDGRRGNDLITIVEGRVSYLRETVILQQLLGRQPPGLFQGSFCAVEKGKWRVESSRRTNRDGGAK